MKELTKYFIKDADSRIKMVSSEELDEKIDLIYSLGYVYNPYTKNFYNPFIDKGLNAMVTYNLNLDRIKNLHNILEQEFFKQNERIRTFDEIKKSIYDSRKFTTIRFLLHSGAGIIGLLFLLLTIIFHITNNLNFALGGLIVSFIFINLYQIENLLYEMYWSDAALAVFWKKSKNFFFVISLLLYPYLYYLLYSYLESYFIPVIIIISMKYLVKKYVTKNLSLQFWQDYGMSAIEEYAEEKGFL